MSLSMQATCRRLDCRSLPGRGIEGEAHSACVAGRLLVHASIRFEMASVTDQSEVNEPSVDNHQPSASA